MVNSKVLQFIFGYIWPIKWSHDEKLLVITWFNYFSLRDFLYNIYICFLHKLRKIIYVLVTCLIANALPRASAFFLASFIKRGRDLFSRRDIIATLQLQETKKISPTEIFVNWLALSRPKKFSKLPRPFYIAKTIRVSQ